MSEDSTIEDKDLLVYDSTNNVEKTCDQLVKDQAVVVED